jgi:hypothetical protein
VSSLEIFKEEKDYVAVSLEQIYVSVGSRNFISTGLTQA